MHVRILLVRSIKLHFPSQIGDWLTCNLNNHLLWHKFAENGSVRIKWCFTCICNASSVWDEVAHWMHGHWSTYVGLIYPSFFSTVCKLKGEVGPRVNEPNEPRERARGIWVRCAKDDIWKFRYSFVQSCLVII